MLDTKAMYERYDIVRKLAKEKRVNRCQAWYYKDRNGDMYLRSYVTLVAVYKADEKVLYSLGRYSMTTYQHIRKFRNDYCPDGHKTKEENLELVNWF